MYILKQFSHFSKPVLCEVSEVDKDGEGEGEGEQVDGLVHLVDPGDPGASAGSSAF